MPGPDAAPLAVVLLFLLSLYGSPGPATLSIAASAAAVGFRRTLRFLTGIVVGLLITQTLAAAGLTLVLAEFPELRVTLFVASFGYVLLLALRIARASPTGAGERALSWVDGLVLNLVNPKAYFVSLAMLSQFSGPDRWPVVTLVLMGGGVGLVVDVMWCGAGGALRRWTVEDGPSARRVRYSMAALLVASVALAAANA